MANPVNALVAKERVQFIAAYQRNVLSQTRGSLVAEETFSGAVVTTGVAFVTYGRGGHRAELLVRQTAKIVRALMTIKSQCLCAFRQDPDCA